MAPKTRRQKNASRRAAVARAQVEHARELKAVFKDAHAYGTRALRAGDLKSFGETIAVERRVIDEQRRDIEAQRDLIHKQRAVIRGPSRPATPKRKTKRRS
jgi:hypothetical protein